MNNVFTAKLLQNLSNKKGNKGFTLIELLVVVIIIGVLAAVALPNLLSQVGKARETEIKNAVGTVNRAQQAYHFERQAFATTTDDLGVGMQNEYIDGNTEAAGELVFGITNTPAAATDPQIATLAPVNAEAINDGTRAYTGGIFFLAGNYNQIL
ncbi:MAG: type IV pilin-like G/H family protein [Cyanobacteria bacterium P01_A01_bin.40]